MRRPALAPLAAVAAFALSACGDDGPGASTPDETPTPTTEAPADTTTPVSEHPVATFRVAGDETFRVELATPELASHARALLAGEDLSAIPLGTVVRDDPGVNAPWSWRHIDPATLEFAFVTTEVCDGIPSFVEDGTVTSDQYCPWSAEVIAVDP